MIEVFRNWINLLLCLGIFITILQLVMPKSNLRKYIYSLVGVLTIIALISPVINVLKNNDMENTLTQVIANIDKTTTENGAKYNSDGQDLIKNNFENKLKEDVKQRLEKKNIIVKEVNIYTTNEYDIEKLDICIENLNKKNIEMSNVTDVIKYINSEYDIDVSKISVIEDGE